MATLTSSLCSHPISKVTIRKIPRALQASCECGFRETFKFISIGDGIVFIVNSMKVEVNVLKADIAVIREARNRRVM